MRNVQTYRIARGTGIALLVAGLTFVSMVLWRQAFFATGDVASYQQVTRGVGGLTATLDSADQFGASVASIGDLNGDGIGDLAVGSVYDDDGSTGENNRGAIYILFMDADGTVDDTTGFAKISDTAGSFSATFANNDNFGLAIANIGDLNNDGVTDLIVSYALGYYVLYLDADGTLDATAGAGAGWTKSTYGGLGLSTIDGFAGIGDLDGDGVEDVAGSSGSISGGGTLRGGVYILYFDTDGTLDNVTPYRTITDNQGGFTASLANNASVGVSVANIGDLNNDGVVDLAVGATLDNGYKGAVYVMFLDADGTLDDTLDHVKISSTTTGFTTALDAYDNFGISIDGPGDLNADGVEDILVGASGDDDGAASRGAIYVLFMDTDGTPDNATPFYRKISDTSGNFTATFSSGDAFGSGVTSADISGDGRKEVFVGARTNDTYVANAGSIYTLFLEAGDLTAPTLSSGVITETGDTDTSIALSWTAATDETSAQGALVYKVYRGADGVDLSTVSNAESNGTLVDTLTGTTTKTVTSLSPETEYEFNVVVQDEAGNKTAYTALSANTDPTPDTTSPTVSSGTITETGETDTTLTFSWTQATDLGTAQEALTYKIYSAVSGADLDSIADTEANGTLKTTVTGAGSGTISGLSELTTYEINVIVSDAAGNKSLYTQMQAGTGATPDTTPPVPGGSGTLQRSSATSNAVAILWTQATDDETAQSSLVYRLYYATSGTDLDSVADTEANGTKFGSDFTDLNSIRVTGLTANTSYTFQLLVEDASGNKAVYTQLSDSFTSASASSVPTLAFPANTVVSINEGMECTNTRSVTLDIQGANVDRIVVADDNRFLGSIWELFTGSPMRRSYVLQDKEGEQTVYVIFRSWHGNKSFIHQDTIVYRPNDESCTYVATEVEGTATAAEGTTTETTTETPTEVTDTTTGISDQVAPTTTTTTTDTATGVTETTTTSPSTGTTTTTTTDTTTGASTTTITTTDTSTNTSTTTVETTNPSGATTTTTETAPITAVVPAVPQAPTVISQQPATTGIPSDAIVHMGSGGQYFYIDRTGNRRYAISSNGIIATWVDVTKIQSFVRKDIVKIPLDTTYVLGPKPGSLIVSFGGKYYWLEPSPDGNPLTPVAREFSSTALITQIFGKSWNKYRVILSDTQIKGVTIGPPILDRSQIQVDPTTLKTLQELKRGG